MDCILTDKDLLVCLGINPYSTDYPTRHSLHVCELATSIGAVMGLGHLHLICLGTGCLVHDVGMKMIDQRVYQHKHRLTQAQFTEIARHPTLALNFIRRKCPHLPVATQLVVYQTHERCNGSGYPKGLTSPSIHFLAKIAAVADAYVALVSRRTYRPALLPYYAMEKMIQDVKKGLFDQDAVRGLLETVSLFPIGSYNQLSDNRVGRIIRSNGQHFSRPVVEIWQQGGREKTPSVVDLTQERDLEIAKPLNSLTVGS